MQTMSESLLLMIVSIAIAVLPVWRSPMISSRCPRPIGIIESIAFSPVCIGSGRGGGGAGLCGVKFALVVERTSQRIDEAAEQLFAHRDLQQLAGALHRVALGHF